ncbi:GATA transcription factor 4-like [Salvia hispanica]|uniref:GATA transcription factor 4-like n=1 Tax=Salvia hispanica TaxID=49212 RepID=UPI002009A724|nr:GATA transcription factor 4-like [Salvia hispanica]
MEYFAADYAEFSSAENGNFNNGVHFTVDDLLDFSKEDETMTDAFFESLPVNSGDSSTVTAVDSCNSSVSGGGDGQFNGNISCRSYNEPQFSGNELCVPYDDLAELEWLSNFVEESFSTGDHRFLPAAAAKTASPGTSSSAVAGHFPSDVSVPGKARSKRSRAPPCDWSSRLLHLAAPAPAPAKSEAPGRKCLHCASEKTPQWRTGPMGPKTLCNACGVRFKSGRLVPEYRPAASPTFVTARHSNSHRKVMELRRQKDVMQRQQMIGHAVFNGCDEFLIHHRSGINGQDMRHVI